MSPEVTQFLDLVDRSPVERAVQRFLEARPYLLLNLLQAPAAAIIKQFPLGSDHRADFAFVHANSGGTYLHLIELESPRKRLFTMADCLTHQFHGAMQQLADWMTWCEARPETVRSLVRPVLRHFGGERLWVRATLVMGRRSEISNERRRTRFEGLVQGLPRRLEVRTFDGLAEEMAKPDGWASITKRARLFSYRRMQLRPVSLSAADAQEVTQGMSRARPAVERSPGTAARSVRGPGVGRQGRRQSEQCRNDGGSGVGIQRGGKLPAGDVTMATITTVVHSDPEILGGTPVFVGTRVPVRTLLDYLAAGDPLEEFLDHFPTVSREQAIAALEEAGELLVSHAHPA